MKVMMGTKPDTKDISDLVRPNYTFISYYVNIWMLFRKVINFGLLLDCWSWDNLKTNGDFQLKEELIYIVNYYKLKA